MKLESLLTLVVVYSLKTLDPFLPEIKFRKIYYFGFEKQKMDYFIFDSQSIQIWCGDRSIGCSMSDPPIFVCFLCPGQLIDLAHQIFNIFFGFLKDWWLRSNDISSSSVIGCCLWLLGDLRQHTELHYVVLAKIKTNWTQTDVNNL